MRKHETGLKLLLTVGLLDARYLVKNLIDTIQASRKHCILGR